MAVFFGTVCTIAGIVSSSTKFVDTELGNYGYHGWTHYLKDLEGVDLCEEESDCRRIGSDGTAYLGPITQDDGGVSYFARVIECSKTSTLTVNYNVASCITNGTWNAKDDTIALLLSKKNKEDIVEKGVKDVISGSGGLLDEEVLDVVGECAGHWETQSYTSLLRNVSAGCEVMLGIKNRLIDDGYAKLLYVYNVEILCERIEATIECPDDDTDGFTAPQGEFCVRGVSNIVNGYYQRKADEQGQDTTQYGGYHVFERDDDTTSGPKYLFEINGNQWVIGDDWSSTTDLYAACPPHTQYDGGDRWLTTIDQCAVQYPPGSEDEGKKIVGASIEIGDCDTNAKGTFINSHGQNSAVSVFASDQYFDIALLVALCLLSFVIGMMAFYGCQLMCYYRTKRRYTLVPNKAMNNY
eukprot:CAMPEP_0197025548 /NCGR_PEP_ID=MMETSP1384-20130603/5843_1 /TAXON_ID=29189 /ORGANISM="Ammonia sp." /LENGTH=409 /DNA_ID=CAMNT_0042454087 /DNA_START=36 /DNA_END=1265 /DNA_ORIENTATION=-